MWPGAAPIIKVADTSPFKTLFSLAYNFVKASPTEQKFLVVSDCLRLNQACLFSLFWKYWPTPTSAGLEDAHLQSGPGDESFGSSWASSKGLALGRRTVFVSRRLCFAGSVRHCSLPLWCGQIIQLCYRPEEGLSQLLSLCEPARPSRWYDSVRAFPWRSRASPAVLSEVLTAALGQRQAGISAGLLWLGPEMLWMTHPLRCSRPS